MIVYRFRPSQPPERLPRLCSNRCAPVLCAIHGELDGDDSAAARGHTTSPERDAALNGRPRRGLSHLAADPIDLTGSRFVGVMNRIIQNVWDDAVAMHVKRHDR